MERSYKTIKKILEYIEEHHDGYSLLFIRNIDGCTFSEILYHVEIMADCGLISMVKDDSCNPRAFADKDYEKNLTWPILGLTWAGHDFLASIRLPEIWNWVLELSEHCSFPVLSALVNKAVRSYYGAPKRPM